MDSENDVQALTELLYDSRAEPPRVPPEVVERHYRQVLLDHPRHAEAAHCLGLLLKDQGRYDEAMAWYRHALAVRPGMVEAHINLGNALTRLARSSEAQACYRQALALEPNDARIHYNLAYLLQADEHLAEAETHYRQALALQPDLVEAHNNLGNVLRDSGRPAAEFDHCFRQAVALRPESVEAHLNLGVGLQLQRRVPEAEASYRQALALGPQHHAVRFNLGIILLLQGRYGEAWPLYESRYLKATADKPDGVCVPPPNVICPQWQGEPLAGKSLLVWPEQGLGDQLQFARFLPLLKARGLTRLSVACPIELRTLFADSFDCVDAWLPSELPLDGADSASHEDAHARSPVPEPHDYWCHLMSVPLHLGITLATLPARLPYLRACAARTEAWRQRLPAGFKVGLVWAGAPRVEDPFCHRIDRRRSLPLRAYLPLLRLTHLGSRPITFISLQKGAAAEAQLADLPAELRPWDPMPEVQDFADTAAIISQLDLVIAVDTSTAHLAAALNRPVWILSRFDGCWRWLEHGETSPWYPGAVRLFRQSEPGDWDAVVVRVAAALAAASTVDHVDRATECRALAVASHPVERRVPVEAMAAVKARIEVGDDWQRRRNFAEAEACYRHAVTLDERHLGARLKLGGALTYGGRFTEAEACYRFALTLAPQSIDVHHALVILLILSEQLAKAEACCREALALRPDAPGLHNLLGALSLRAGRLAEAQDSFVQVLLQQPGYLPARYNLSLVWLTMGRYRQAWPLYETRYVPSPQWGPGDHGCEPPPVSCERWRGQPLAGKSLLVWPEQGYGDFIQFVRYLPLLKARGVARLSVACPPVLRSLVEGMAGVDAWVAPERGALEQAALPPHDYWCFIMSLPLHCQTTLETIPRALPYLKVSDQRVAHWAQRLPAAGYKIGLVWCGEPRTEDITMNTVDRRRSMGVTELLPLLQLSAQCPDLTWVSLQYGTAARAQLEALPAALRPLDLMGEVRDFADTAALIQSLDLVVAVDTSVAHLAGALNRPVWILSRFDGCWRWLQDRDDTPWYPGVARLFRQPGPGDWATVVTDVERALRSRLLDAQVAIAKH